MTGTGTTSAPRAVTNSSVVRPRGLTVLYDSNCPVCRRARSWVEHQRRLVRIEFVPAGSRLARDRFPQLDVGSTFADVTVVSDRGAVLRGDAAWITVLWAIERTRPLAVKLARGQRHWMFRKVKGATEAIRKLSAGHPDRTDTSVDPARWPPPAPVHAPDTTCSSCRT